MMTKVFFGVFVILGNLTQPNKAKNLPDLLEP